MRLVQLGLLELVNKLRRKRSSFRRHVLDGHKVGFVVNRRVSSRCLFFSGSSGFLCLDKGLRFAPTTFLGLGSLCIDRSRGGSFLSFHLLLGLFSLRLSVVLLLRFGVLFLLLFCCSFSCRFRFIAVALCGLSFLLFHQQSGRGVLVGLLAHHAELTVHIFDGDGDVALVDVEDDGLLGQLLNGVEDVLRPDGKTAVAVVFDYR